ncbi:hypothetical protein [Alcanivorax sp. 1008]|uniref:hypothetical protein n=1 Tax=Alcanivorax sp. 1008 TaxID=2816853 RepID=UPI001D50914C|nr:hypothetical protein [Alcanivorax sp. 1008]MCC1496793.1 hypothetical protein [Alcanivorax sp. 1008]
MRLACYGAFFLPAGYAPDPGDRFPIHSIPPIRTIGLPALSKKGLSLLHGFYSSHSALMHIEKDMDALPKGKKQWVYPVEVYLRGISDHKNNTDIDVMRGSTILYISKCRAALLEQLDEAYTEFLKQRNVPIKRRPRDIPSSTIRFSWQPELLTEFLRSYPPTKHLEAVIYPIMGSDREEYSFVTILSRDAIDSYKVPDCDGVILDFIID